MAYGDPPKKTIVFRIDTKQHAELERLTKNAPATPRQANYPTWTRPTTSSDVIRQALAIGFAQLAAEWKKTKPKAKRAS